MDITQDSDYEKASSETIVLNTPASGSRVSEKVTGKLQAQAGAKVYEAT